MLLQMWSLLSITERKGFVWGIGCGVFRRISLSKRWRSPEGPSRSRNLCRSWTKREGGRFDCLLAWQIREEDKECTFELAFSFFSESLTCWKVREVLGRDVQTFKHKRFQKFHGNKVNGPWRSFIEQSRFVAERGVEIKMQRLQDESTLEIIIHVSGLVDVVTVQRYLSKPMCLQSWKRSKAWTTTLRTKFTSTTTFTTPSNHSGRSANSRSRRRVRFATLERTDRVGTDTNLSSSTILYGIFQLSNTFSHFLRRSYTNMHYNIDLAPLPILFDKSPSLSDHNRYGKVGLKHDPPVPHPLRPYTLKRSGPSSAESWQKLSKVHDPIMAVCNTKGSVFDLKTKKRKTANLLSNCIPPCKLINLEWDF